VSRPRSRDDGFHVTPFPFFFSFYRYPTGTRLLFLSFLPLTVGICANIANPPSLSFFPSFFLPPLEMFRAAGLFFLFSLTQRRGGWAGSAVSPSFSPRRVWVVSSPLPVRYPGHAAHKPVDSMCLPLLFFFFFLHIQGRAVLFLLFFSLLSLKRFETRNRGRNPPPPLFPPVSLSG